MKVLLVTNQYIDVREDGCWCNFALYGTLKNMTTLGDMYIIAGKLRADRTPAQPLNCKVDFLKDDHVKHLFPTNRSISSYLKNRSLNKSLLATIIPTVDLVIGYAPLEAAELAQELAKKNNKPFLCFLVACPWDALHNHQRLLARLIAPVRYLRTRKMVAESDYVHYVTSEFLQKRYPTKGKSLGCSDVNLGELDKNALSLRLNKLKKLNASHQINIVTTAGVDVRYKGQEYVIRALAKLKKQGVNKYRYHLVGGGNGLYLRRLAQSLGVDDCVEFCGRKATEEVFDILRNSDVYIQPSLQEGLPRSVVEAMSFAMPCIGFNTGGIPELLNPKFVVKRKSVDGIIQALLALEDEDTYIKESKRNFTCAQTFEHSRLQSQIREFFKEIKKEIEKNRSCHEKIKE